MYNIKTVLHISCVMTWAFMPSFGEKTFWKSCNSISYFLTVYNPVHVYTVNWCTWPMQNQAITCGNIHVIIQVIQCRAPTLWLFQFRQEELGCSHKLSYEKSRCDNFHCMCGSGYFWIFSVHDIKLLLIKVNFNRWYFTCTTWMQVQSWVLP